VRKATLATLCAAAALASVAVWIGGAGAASQKPPQAVPAYYLTAHSVDDLAKQAEAIGRKFAGEQPPGHAVLVLDFGAARNKDGEYGTALRGGTFFTNGQIESALDAAGKGYSDAHRRGSVTIVYANSNADLGNPEGGEGYKAFDEDMGRKAGREQATTAGNAKSYPNVSYAVGGDIEPGLQGTAEPDVPIAMVEGAIDEGGGMPYYDVGTAPCGKTQCFGKWTVKDLCSVVSGQGRHPLPEVYFAYQATDWGHVAKGCGLDSFAGASASGIGDLSPSQTWKTLRKKSGAGVGEVLVRFPG
jgi:hypothetical protein